MIVFGTKAETLNRISAYNSTFNIPKSVYCTYKDWRDHRQDILSKYCKQFDQMTLAVRSSALVEDGSHASMAGAFTSFLDVQADKDELSKAIDSVFSSYGESCSEADQVLIQKMVKNVAISGVAMTHNLQDGAPYYSISYDDFSGRTDTVTSGAYPHKTIMVHRFCPDVVIRSPRVRAVLRLVRDIESLMGTQPMDIEFAVDLDGQSYLLQLRPIAAEHRWSRSIDLSVNGAIKRAEEQLESLSLPGVGVHGDKTILANMPDWNPAEMIQNVPRPLAASLYRYLITRSVWADARADMGYAPLAGVELMKLVAGHAYIDVRASLNSLLPAGLSSSTKDELISSSLDRLSMEPRFHDKLEFELAVTVHTPSFEEDVARIYPDLTKSARDEFSKKLKVLTNSVISVAENSSLSRAEKAVKLLETRQKTRPMIVDAEVPDTHILERISVLASECIMLGTKPFAILARHGFIAHSWLMAMEKCGVLVSDRCDRLKASVTTVASELSEMMFLVQKGQISEEEFHTRFGHLRPGTYDVESLRYIDRKDLFANEVVFSPPKRKQIDFSLTPAETTSVGEALNGSGVTGVNAEGLVNYIQRATSGREWAKLIFTRNLSDILELVALWGARKGLNREEISFFDIQWLFDELFRPEDNAEQLNQKLRQNKENWNASSSVCLPHILMNKNDLFVIPLQRSLPNFVTRKTVEGRIVNLGNASSGDEKLEGRIVCIQSADPGFDWIFSRGIAGLVTLHGGPNSHMAIRCTEFSLPAAIGVGEELFTRILQSGFVRMECAKKLIQVELS